MLAGCVRGTFTVSDRRQRPRHPLHRHHDRPCPRRHYRVAPAAEWIAANPIEQTVSPDFDADIIACFEWFTDPDGNPSTMDDVLDVVQNSWGVNSGLGYPQCDSRWWDVIDACEAAGPVVIFAAGNEGDFPFSLRSPADRATSLTN
jgi:hypothetical protein